MSESKKIVLTGVSRGLGRALVDALIAEGHQLSGVARSAEAIWQLQQTYGEPHRFDTLDLTDDKAVQRWATTICRDIGPPDILINNAATINDNAPLWEVPIDQFELLVRTNLVSVFSVIRHYLPAMIDARHGLVVNLSSGWGRSVASDVAPYCMTKWGIEGMTRALATELPDGMGAIPLSPGVVDTDMLRRCFGDSAGDYPTAEQWASSAAPFIAALGPEHNGVPLTTPG